MVCSLEFPDLEPSIWQAYQNQSVQVIGANSSNGDDASTVQLFVDQTGITFPVGFDTNNSYQQFRTDTQISPYPLDVIIDADGIVQYVNMEYDPEAMINVIEGLLQ